MTHWRNNRIINTETTYKMNDRQTDVKHKFQNQSARMLPLSAQHHDKRISATGVPTTLLLSRFFRSTETVRLDGVGAQDGYLDFYIAPELWAPLLLSRCFSSTKTVRLDGVGAQDGYLDFYIASKLWAPLLLSRCFSSTKTVRLIRDG